MYTITVLSVDDHPLLREGIAAVIATQADVVVAGEASDGDEAVARYRELRPDVVLMDLQMPRMRGVEAIVAIRDEFPDARIVVLTAYRGDVQVAQALRAGAVGYLLKDSLRKELLDAIRAVHAGRRRVSPELAIEMAEHQGEESLTRRELDVLRRMVAGCANKAIADALSIGEETVKSHVRSILAKLTASDRTHAVAIALRRGIVDVGPR